MRYFNTPLPSLKRGGLKYTLWGKWETFVKKHSLSLLPQFDLSRTFLHRLPRLYQVIGSLDKWGEAGNWSACSWCGLPCGGVDAPYAVLGHHSLIIPPLCIRHGTFLVPSSGLHAFGLPLPRVVIGGVAHVVIYKRVLGLLIFVVAVAHLYMRGDGTGRHGSKPERKRADSKVTAWT